MAPASDEQGQSKQKGSQDQRLSTMQWLMIGGRAGTRPPTWANLMSMAQARKNKAKEVRKSSREDSDKPGPKPALSTSSSSSS